MDYKRAIKIMKYHNRVHTNIHPPSMQVALTDKCFNQCDFCDHWKRDAHNSIPLDVWINYLYHASNNGLESVCYIGGDGMAYKHMNEVMAYHIQNGVAFGFITTGYVPPTINMEYLKYARWIRCSFDAYSNELYSKVRGGVKPEKVKASIEAMVNAGCNVELFCTLRNETIPDAINIIEYALKLGINLALTPAEKGTCEMNKVKPALDGAAMYWPQKFKDAGLSLTLDNHTGDREKYNFNKCSAVYYQLYVEASGDIYPCCHIAGDTKLHPFSQPLANIKDGWEDICEARRKFAELDSNMRPSRCQECGERFQTINHLVESITHRNEFF